MTESQDTINTIAEYLDSIGLQYMATNGLDGKPKVRPVQYMVVRDGKLWFCTNSQKAMYAEMQASPFVELCGSRLLEDELRTPWIRFSAEAVFPDESDDKEKKLVDEVKAAIMEKSQIVHEIYKDNQGAPTGGKTGVSRRSSLTFRKSLL